MSEFRVGQRVRVKERTRANHTEYAGKTGEVTEIGNNWVELRFPQSPMPHTFDADELEPVDPPASGDEFAEEIEAARKWASDWFQSDIPGLKKRDIRRLLDALDDARRERDAAVAALDTLVDDMRDAYWNGLSDDICRQVTDVLGERNGKTWRYASVIKESADDHE